jgi:hypothetical protein
VEKIWKTVKIHFFLIFFDLKNSLKLRIVPDFANQSPWARGVYPKGRVTMLKMLTMVPIEDSSASFFRVSTIL